MSNGGFGGIHDKLIARLASCRRIMNKAITLALTGASGAPMPCACWNAWCRRTIGLPARLLGGRVVLKTEQQQDWPGSPGAVGVPLSPIWRRRVRSSPAARGVVLAGGFRLGGPQTDGGLPLLHGHRLGHCQRHSDNLLERAADVVIKERGQLILVPQESPSRRSIWRTCSSLPVLA
jgi:4-hydroxy-3-polyprenylbenzoate decarboxylase